MKPQKRHSNITIYIYTLYGWYILYGVLRSIGVLVWLANWRKYTIEYTVDQKAMYIHEKSPTNTLCVRAITLNAKCTIIRSASANDQLRWSTRWGECVCVFMCAFCMDVECTHTHIIVFAWTLNYTQNRARGVSTCLLSIRNDRWMGNRSRSLYLYIYIYVFLFKTYIAIKHTHIGTYKQ